MALSALAMAGLGLAPPIAAASARPEVRRGPSGARFYDPPRRLPAGPHGTLIWDAPMHGASALPGAVNTRILYTQRGVDGALVATSGYLSVPHGRPPKGGWPLVTWAHGTTGLADQCAPSRAAQPGDSDNINLVDSWVKDGYAVVSTDYEGLGTPGPLPYLIARSSAYSVLDAVRAAHEADPSISRDYVIAGHSEGADATLWASTLAHGYLHGFTLRGEIAFAPPSLLGAEILYSRKVTSSALSHTLAAIVYGLDVAEPTLDGASLFSTAAAAQFPQVAKVCFTQLAQDYAQIPADQMFSPGANLLPLAQAASRNDVTRADPRSQLLIEQGADDTTVNPKLTELLAKIYRVKRVREQFDLVPDATHETVTALGAPRATQFLEARLKR